MQNNSNRLDMPGGFKDSPANDTSFSSSHARDTSATSNPDPTPIATTMRSANVVNPHGSAYEVAGPSPGGASPIHNRTLDAVKGQSLNDPAGDPSGTPAHGLVETVKENAAAAATGAAAAGASVIAAAKKLISGHDDQENELGDYSQHDSSFQPTSNINTTTGTTAINNTISPASQIVSSPRTPSVTSTPSPKPLGPHDRPPIKVAIHAHKPSDKATYGNLDSPGAQNHPGPLSDRALAGTPPPSSLSTPKKTIADPFGPVMVANWNDHKRQADVSTPTSEDFDNPQFGTPMRSSTAPSAQPAAAAAASKRMPAPSPLREEVPPVKKAAAVPIAQPSTDYFPHAQHSSTMDAATPHHPSTMTAAIPHHEHKEPLTERIKEAFSHHDHPHTTATTATAGTIAAAVPASHQPNVSEPSHTTTTTKPTVVKMEPLGERIKEVFHHESHPTVEVPIKVNTATIATSSAAPEVFINRTENVPIENLKDIDLSKVAQAASHMPDYATVTETTTTSIEPAIVAKEPLSSRIKEAFSHHETHPTTTASSTTTVPKEPLGERIKDVFHRDSHASVEVPIKVNTSTIATTSAAPEVFINRTECVPVENLKDLDLTKVAQGASRMQPDQTSATDKTTTTTTPAASKAAYERGGEALADRVKEIFHHDNSTTAKESLVDRVKDVFHRDDHPSETVPHTTTSSSHRSAVPAAVTAATAGTATGVAAFLHDKESDNMTTPPHAHDHRGYLPPITKSTIPTTTTEQTSAHGEIKSHVFMPMDTSPPKKRTPVPAPVFDMTYMNIPPRTAAHPVRPVEHTEYTISPPITATTTATKAPGVAPVAPIVPVISSTTTKPNTSEIQFTDPKTLRPVTEQLTWDIPTPTDHRSMGAKIKDAITFHTSSEYGPADPKDLHLSDPKTLHLMDRAPVAAAATAAGAAAVVAPIVHNKNTTTPTTTTTTPSTGEIQFTDPKTLRPLTGTRTWDIPTPADHRSMGTKIKDAITFHTSSEYGPADPKDLHLSDPKTLHLMDRAPVAAAATAAGAAAVVAPIIHNKNTTTTATNKDAPIVAPAVAPAIATTTTTTPSTSEIQFTDPKTLRPLTGTRTWDIPTPADHRSMGTKIKDAITFHTSSEYGPADPKDLHLSDPKTLHLMDRAPVAAAATAVGAAAVAAPLVTKSTSTPTTAPAKDASVAAPVVAPVIATTTATKPNSSEIQFTDPKTLRPLTGTRTWDIPTPPDNRSMGSKIKDAITFHTSSEYGPADPKDLHLSDPKTLHLMDRAPVAAAATAAGAAAVTAPIIHKATTTTTETRPVVVKEEKHNPVLSAPRPVIPITTTTNEPNPVPSAPHPVIPKTLSTKEEVNPVLSAPHPIIPEKKISTTHVDPTPVQTAPRPMIPASAIETHSTTGNTMSPSHPVIPVVDKHATATTTSQHSGPEKIVAPIVAAAAAAPIIQHHQQQQQQQQQQQHTTPAPVVQQQQQHQMSTTTTPQNTNSYNTSSYNSPASAAPIVTQPRPSTTEVSAADKIASAIPEAYSGPLPKVQPGEEVVWVKTVTTTDFYGDNSPPAPGPPIVHNTAKNNNNHNNGVDHVGGPGIQEVPANTMHDNHHVPHRKRLSAFFDRLIHRHHDNVDKGKQRI